MTNELVLNATSYGIEESKAKQLEKVFVPMVEKFKELEDQYNEVLSNKEITKQVCADAKSVRNKYVKVRTGADEIHKIAKSNLLIQTRAIDGLRNLVKFAVIDHENSLMEVEKHFEKLEAEKLEAIREKRESILLKFGDNPGIGDLSTMSEEVWSHYISSVETTFKAKIEAEKKAEAERIELERIEKLRWERADIIRPYYDFFEDKNVRLGEMSDTDFISLTSKLKIKKVEYQKEQERVKIENEKLKKEAEAKRIADEKAEKERQRLAKIESEKRAKEEKERIAKQEKERKEHESILKTERETKEKIERELNAKQEKERKEKEAKELSLKKEAEEKRKLDLAPEKIRLTKWVNDMEIIDIMNQNMSKDSALIASDIISKFDSFKNWAKSEIDKIK